MGSPSGTLFSTETSELTHQEKVWRKLKCIFPKLKASLLMATFHMIPTIQHLGKFKTMERVKRFVGLPRRCCCCCQVTLVVSDSVRPHRRQPTRLLCPWHSPGKNTGVGCHFLLQCMKVKSESEVAQSCLTLSYPVDWSLPGSSAHGIFQARVLEWGCRT